MGGPGSTVEHLLHLQHLQLAWCAVPGTTPSPMSPQFEASCPTSLPPGKPRKDRASAGQSEWWAVFGVSGGVRTRVAGVKGQSPRPLDDRDISISGKTQLLAKFGSKEKGPFGALVVSAFRFHTGLILFRYSGRWTLVEREQQGRN